VKYSEGGKLKVNDVSKMAERVANMIMDAKKVVFFTGAGISTESGIPDFRSPGGIWEKFDPSDFTYERFINNEESRKKHWEILCGGLATGAAEPNAAHWAITELDKMHMVDCVITQNIDNLHQKSGFPDGKMLELHGSMQWSYCLNCGKRYSTEEIEDRLDLGVELPECADCGGILKPNVVLFGEQLPANVLNEAAARASECDLMIVIGSTLTVYPAAYMPVYAVNAGAKLVIINLSDTPMDGHAEVVIRSRAGQAMVQILDKLCGKMAS